MKIRTILTGLLFSGLLCPALASAKTQPSQPNKPQADQGTLVVHVSGIRNSNGVIRIALFNSPDTFQAKDSKAMAVQKSALVIQNDTADWTVKNVPYGVYAIKLFHDENNSGQLEKSFTGRPKEGIGFSNNPPVTNRAPSFDEAKFTFNQPEMKINIQMINP